MRNLTGSGEVLSEDDLLALYEPPADSSAGFVRFNFVMTADGGATHRGVSGDIGGPADKQMFQLLRRFAHVLLMGARTVRAEGYEGDVLSLEDKSWRSQRGLSEYLRVALISGSLHLDPQDKFFLQSPTVPLIYTSESSSPDQRAKLSDVAEIVLAGKDRVEPQLVVQDLLQRGYSMIHSEGGPTVLGEFQQANLVDSLCVTLAPKTAGPGEKRIGGDSGNTATNELRDMQLHHVLEQDGELVLEYRK
ncbi:dihydrofolate reductase family protein [Neomicrococcus aestuarii]|uniref:Bacterial bifunctional deaminase-reductase C-terminal domain-containing protein n=1 Tax=Neomicrococcus aestuarii TaxID=556325 RepID=A0A1L2ZKG5_9MICC|nr:dihydrofolate reductase family protein [Neomicrococcus aestuarii]APF39700.1 hypothetical protein BHE16_00220 [Neomicrococcus aestuarii]